MSPIVVGYDGSPGAADALALAETLARPLGASLVLACVGGPDADAALSAAEVGAGLDVERVPVMARSVARGLSDLVAERGAGLLVVGASRYAPAGLVVPGSVGSQLVDGARSPVAFAPRGYHSGSAPTEIIAAIDGPPSSGAVTRYAARVADSIGASLRTLPFDPADRGRAASRVVAECRPRIDVLVMSSLGYGSRTAQLAGLPARVLDAAPCPVVIVPRGTTVKGHDE